MNIHRRSLLAGLAIGLPPLARSPYPNEVYVGLAIDLPAMRIPHGVHWLRTTGHRIPGIGAAKLERVDHTWPVEARHTDLTGDLWAVSEANPTYEMFGAVGDGISDDTVALVAANAFVERRGGGLVSGAPDAKYRTSREIRAGRSVINDLAGGSIIAYLREANDAAVSLSNNSSWRNGSIRVISSAPPGSQMSCHAAVRAGPLIGASVDSGLVDPQEGVSGWTLENLLLDTDATDTSGGRVAVQINGGTHSWACRQLSCPDNTVMAGFIHADWSAVGAIQTSEDRISSNAPNGLNGRPEAWTTHPHNGVIEDCRGGRLSAARQAGETGSHGFRLSACHDIVIRRCVLAGTTFAGLRIVGGDLGFEFALPNARQRANRGIRIEDTQVQDLGPGYGLWIDLNDDNVERATLRGAYARRITRSEADVVINRIAVRGSMNSETGIRLDNVRGCTVTDCEVSSARDGLVIGHGCSRIELIRPTASLNRRNGIVIDHHAAPPSEILIESPRVFSNGLAEGGEHIHLGHCSDVTVVGGEFGSSDGPDGVDNGIRIAFPERNNRLTGSPRFLGTLSGSAAIRAG